MDTRLTGKKVAILAASAAVLATVVLAFIWLVRRASRTETPRLAHRTVEARGTGSVHLAGRAGQSSAGWHHGADVETSVRGALEAAKTAEGPSPDFVMIVFDPEADGAQVISTARRMLGPHPKIFGLASHRPEILDAGSLAAGRKSGHTVAVLAVRSSRIRFGVGAAELRAPASPREAGREALRRAMVDAGKTIAERPQVILLAPTRGSEEELIAGIEDIVGKSVPVLGGTAAPSGFVIGGDDASKQGVSVAVLYTRLTIGWTFEAGYDVSLPKSGVVTRTEGRVISEIDHRPGWEVYDEWLEGRLSEAVLKGADEAGQLLALNPCYRQLKAPSGQVFALFSHALPMQRSGRWAIAVSTSIKTGDRIYLSHGTWELLMNRVVSLPRVAKARGGLEADEKPLFGIGFLCAGVAGVLPAAELPKIPLLLAYGMNGAPYLAAVTSGEQGFLPGIGNKHANLSTGFLVVRDEN